MPIQVVRDDRKEIQAVKGDRDDLEALRPLRLAKEVSTLIDGMSASSSNQMIVGRSDREE
jgi:hypothetical protein